jgi:AcrR family transcriptional regulator
MARPVKPEAVAKKRQEILDAAERFVFTKGYEHMSIQDILDEVKMSSGAFHHYFASRAALLSAFIERIRQETEKPLLPIVHDRDLSAIAKLQGFFETLGRLRSARQGEVVQLLRVWYTDANALMRQKVDEAIRQQRAPLLTEIVHQGVREGLFTTAFPEKAGEVLLSLLQGMWNTHARFLLSLGQEGDEERVIEEIVATHAAYMEAIERVLGAPPHSFSRLDAPVVNVWVRALRENENA